MWSCWNFEIIIWRSLYSTTTTYTTTTIIGNFFFLLRVFLSLLNNYILLDYVTTHGQPLLAQTWYGVDFACFICTWDSRHLATTATNRAMMKGAATTTQTTHICHNISLVCFFWPFTCFFLSYRLLLNNYILLDYVTTHDHPLLVQTRHRVGFVCFICTQDSCHVTATATKQAMTKGAATTTPTTHIHYNISSVYFLFGLLHLICFTEQLYF